MDPVDQTPTEPVDYAVLNAAYGSLLATLVVAVRATKLEREPIAPAEWLPLAAATFALSKLVVNEKVVSWARAPFVAETSEGRRPRGRRLRYAVGELLELHPLRRRVGGPGRGRLAARVAARGPDRCRRTGRLGRQRRAAVGLRVAVRPDRRRAAQ